MNVENKSITYYNNVKKVSYYIKALQMKLKYYNNSKSFVI